MGAATGEASLAAMPWMQLLLYKPQCWPGKLVTELSTLARVWPSAATKVGTARQPCVEVAGHCAACHCTYLCSRARKGGSSSAIGAAKPLRWLEALLFVIV